MMQSACEMRCTVASMNIRTISASSCYTMYILDSERIAVKFMILLVSVYLHSMFFKNIFYENIIYAVHGTIYVL